MQLSSYLSPARFYESYLRNRFSAAGLVSQTLTIDSHTNLHFWGPPPGPAAANSSPIILLHGFGPTAVWQWRRQVDFLSSDPGFRIYVPDLVFFGESSTESAGRSEVFQAECVARLMDHVEADGGGERERFYLAGTSYGGFVAYHVARMWPERVEKVVIASSGVNMRRRDNEELVKRANCGCIEELMLPSTAAELRGLLALASSSSISRLIPDFFWNDFIRNLYSDKREEKIELLKAVTLGRDDNVNLTPLQQEVLIIWGEQDQIFPVKMAYELKEILGPKAKLELIKNSSHVPQIENAQEFNDIFLNFLRGT